MQALCKDLERAEVKKWLHQILEILLAERAKSIQEKEHAILSELVKKHEDLIPMVQKTSVMVDLYWKCYACGDKLKPHVKFLDDIVLSSTRHVSRILMISMCERCVGLKVLKDRPVLKSATSTSSAILLRVPTLPWMRTIATKSTRRMGSFPKKPPSSANRCTTTKIQ